jgi:LmbE family N-acetylglucosaminyl deacetylase
MELLPIQNVIPETHIVAFAPHYDDFLLGLGGYVLELKAQGLLHTKHFHILLIFGRSNYQAGSGAGNYDTSLERLKLATGRRLLEELDCLDELLGEHSYRYELRGERECMVRGKAFADSEMEFPHGMYADFTDQDRAIFSRLQALVQSWAGHRDTALVFPLAIEEHIDHFLVREAGILAVRTSPVPPQASFYFVEDKPYAGIQTPAEAARAAQIVDENRLLARLYRSHPQEVVNLAFKHYLSQVEDVYRKGVLQRAAELQSLYGLGQPAEQLFAYDPSP